MKIGFDIRNIAYHSGSGLYTYSYNVIRELIERKIIDCKIYGYDIDNKMFSRKIALNNINQIQISRNENFWYNMYNSKWDFKNPNVDIFFNMTNGIGIPKRGYKNLYVTIHDLIPYIYPESCDKEHLKYVLTNTPKIINKIDKIFTVSNNSKRDIIKYFNIPEDRIIVTYLAANNSYKVINKIHACRYVKHKYGIDDNYVIYVGGFSERKNIITLINAFEILRRKHMIKTKLVIVGKLNRTYDMLYNAVCKYKLSDDVIFIGYIPESDLPYLYNASLALVYPSLYEGFGLPILEAMKCGTPVIAANNSSIKEVFENSIILVESLDVDAYANKLRELYKNKKMRYELIEKEIKDSNKFSWAKVVDTLEKEIKIN